jgi:4-methyl-5(b-hydroxyethyl)-thiazole monophosphate biosynthesis
MSKHVLVPVADGSEDIETVALVDTLRRANCDVVVASVSGKHLVTLSRKIKIEADVLIEEVKEQSFDGIFLPG